MTSLSDGPEKLEQTPRPEGWGLISNSRKWHYYVNGHSLCRGFMKFTDHDLEQGNDRSPDNCAKCQKQLAKRQDPANDRK